MSQNHDIAEKLKIEVDGEELEGLIKQDEAVMEEEAVEVPEFGKKRQVSNGVKKIPALNCTFKVRRNSRTLQILQDWFDKDESHDIVIINTDADGQEYKRTLFPEAECIKFPSNGGYDAASPTVAQIATTFLPWDVIRVKA